MPRSRESELPHGQSLRGALPVRTSSSSGSDSLNRRSSKVGVPDRRSPRSSQPDSLQQKKKLGTRIADLESQLGQAQVELKKLKDHLASAKCIKREAQPELQMKVQKPIVPETHKEDDPRSSSPQEVHESTDVFEVPKKVEDFVEPPPTPPLQELKKPFHDDSVLLKAEIGSLNEKLTEKEMELELSREELDERRTEICMLNEKLEAAEAAKVVLEIEMTKLRVQTEQWKKAADAAAAILSGGVEMNGRRSTMERCGSMDKHLGSGFEKADGFGGLVGSPLVVDDLDDGFGIGKRKSAGIRMFGDLWKRKGQK